MSADWGQKLPKTKTITIEILHPKLSDSVGLVMDIVVDRCTSSLELSQQRIGVVDPKIDVPQVRVYFPMWHDHVAGRRLVQHQVQAVAP